MLHLVATTVRTTPYVVFFISKKYPLIFWSISPLFQIKQALKTRLQSGVAVENVLDEIHKSVNVFVTLISICKTHEKVSCTAIPLVLWYDHLMRYPHGNGVLLMYDTAGWKRCILHCITKCRLRCMHCQLNMGGDSLMHFLKVKNCFVIICLCICQHRNTSWCILAALFWEHV